MERKNTTPKTNQLPKLPTTKLQPKHHQKILHQHQNLLQTPPNRNTRNNKSKHTTKQKKQTHNVPRPTHKRRPEKSLQHSHTHNESIHLIRHKQRLCNTRNKQPNTKRLLHMDKTIHNPRNNQPRNRHRTHNKPPKTKNTKILLHIRHTRSHQRNSNIPKHQTR